jgi:predicted TPR repeat methyltransferase
MQNNDKPPINSGLEQYFDTEAQIYDKDTAEANFTVNQHLSESLKRHYRKTVTHLDLGSGTGQTIEAVRNACQPEYVFAVDLSGSMIDQANIKFPGLFQIKSDITEFLYKNKGTFSLITAVGCLEFVESLPDTINLLKEHLNKGGMVAFTYEPLLPESPNQNLSKTVHKISEDDSLVVAVNRWSPDEINNALVNSGLNIIEQSKIIAYQSADGPISFEFVLAERV